MSEFNVADLVATLRLDKGSYDRDLAASKARTEQFAQGVSKAGSAMGGALTSGLRKASVATGLATGGAVALLASVTKTGAAYNMLQQNSRASLTTMLGGAKAANAQMDKLDAFAKNSPFAKDVFIKAQQQLIGFGVETKKVLPTLDAIQNSVAAFGGKSEDIGSITDVLARLQSQGRLSGEALERLGYYGIDAANIIGEKMGKTGAEIKKMAGKPGGIPVEKVWDPLVNGLQEKFGGTTALVKKQMSGAVDRVRAAGRDIGGILAEPFIKKNGGGRAVVWANEFADVLRAAEKKAGPLVNMLTGRLNPAFNELSGFLHDAKNSISGFDVSSLNGGLDKLSAHAPAIAGLAAGFAAMGTQLPILARMGLAVNPLAAGIIAVVAASPELRGVFSDALAAGQPLIPLLGELAGIFSKGLTTGISAAVPLLESGVDAFSGLVGAAGPVVDMLGTVVEGFSQLPGPVQTALVAFTGFALMRGKLDWLKDIGQSIGGTAVAGFQKFRNEMDLVHGAMRFPDAGQSLQVLDRQINMASTSGSTALSKLSTAAKITGKGLLSGLKGAATGVMNVFGGPWGIAIGLGAAALGAYAAKQAEARQRAEEFRSTLDETTGAITKNTEAMAAQALAGDDGSKGFYLWSSGAEDVSKTLDMLGKSTQDTASIVANGGTDYDNMIGLLKDYEEATKAAAGETDAFGNTISTGDGGAALDAWAAKMDITGDAARKLSTVDMAHLISALEQQRSAVADASGNWSEMNDSMSNVPTTQSKVAAAISKVGDAAADTSARLTAYQQIIDLMNGKVPDAEEQQRKLAATSRTLGEFFRETGEDGKRLNVGLVSAKDGTIALSDAGDRLMGILGPQADAAKAAALAAADNAKANGDAAGAAAAADAALKPMRDTIMGLAKQGYISKDAATALATSLLGIPGETSVAITDDGSIQATKLKVEDIARLVEKSPKGTVTIEDNAPEVTDRLAVMGYEIEHIGEGRVTITDDGTIQATNDRVSALAKKVINTPNGKVTITENSPVVIAALEALGFKIKRLPNGKIEVTDAGTARKTGGKIDAEARKKRTAQITAQAVGTATANAALNAVAKNRTSTITVTTRNRTISMPGQVIRPGQVGWHNSGGRIPKKADGGRLPNTGRGRDKILGIGSDGTPTAWVDDGEWVIKRSSSKKHDRLLAMINRDDPALKNIKGLQKLAGGGQVYTVRRGDTLSEIGARFGVSWRTLQSINGIANANRIYVGQEIRLSKSAAAKTSASNAKKKAAPAKKKVTNPKPTSGLASAWASWEAREEAEDVKYLQTRLKSQKSAVSAAEKKYKAAKSKSGKASAKKALDAAKKKVTATEKAVAKEQEKVRDAKVKAARLSELEFDLRRDIKRGTIVEAVTSGSGLQIVDRLFEQSKNKDLSSSKRRSLSKTASSAESKLLSWYKQLDKIETKIDSARGKYEDLIDTRDKASQTMQGESGIQNVVDNVQRNGFAGLSLKSITAGFKTDAARIKAFGKKIQQLQKKGYAGLLIEEIVQMGSEAGSQVADELLKGSSTDVKSLNVAYKSVATNSNQLGTYLTDAFYKGGVNAAKGVVAGLESQQKKIEAAVAKVGKSMETALKKSLGIKSPSRVAKAITDNFTGTIRDNLAKAVPGVKVAAGGVGGAMAAGVRASNATTAAVNAFASSAGPNGERPQLHVHVDAQPGTAWQYAKDVAKETAQKLDDALLTENLHV
ncbi:tape measure protein [Arthrobacter sp.]|uniref:tape measure protein n=1 Tax=Arthrobacter sp. TaxID=1667 RepID=UPI003A92F220